MRVEFYCSTQTNPQARLILVCRCIASAYDQNRKVHIHCQDEPQAYRLDELLWTFQDDSFIPHNFIGDGPDTPPPVRLGYGEMQPRTRDILVNLADEVPEFHNRFQQIYEIVGADDGQKEISRAHYRLYRELGYELQSYQSS